MSDLNSAIKSPRSPGYYTDRLGTARLSRASKPQATHLRHLEYAAGCANCDTTANSMTKNKLYTIRLELPSGSLCRIGFSSAAFPPNVPVSGAAAPVLPKFVSMMLRCRDYLSRTCRSSTRFERTCSRLKPIVAKWDGKNALDSFPLEMILGCTFSEARNCVSSRVHSAVRLRSAMTDAKSARAPERMP